MCSLAGRSGAQENDDAVAGKGKQGVNEKGEAHIECGENSRLQVIHLQSLRKHY